MNQQKQNIDQLAIYKYDVLSSRVATLMNKAPLRIEIKKRIPGAPINSDIAAYMEKLESERQQPLRHWRHLEVLPEQGLQ